MTDRNAAMQLGAARAGDPDAFQQLSEPFRRELLVHCYRMLGSLEDAEDTLQETLLRAWRHLDSFQERASLRAWLYKISTNACLDALAQRKRRGTPLSIFAPADPNAPLAAPALEAFWIEPLPDTLADEQRAANPEARYDTHESITFAFLSAIQNLPGRQRAVLLLRDVLGWSAGESAEILDMTVAAVNSALQRARATMKHGRSDPDRRHPVRRGDELTSALLARYVQAWESSDSDALVALLREDATLSMPPLPTWYRGAADIQTFLDRHIFAGAGGRGRFRLAATRANGSPAFGMYQADGAGVFMPVALHVLTLADGRIAAIDDFLTSDVRLFSRFGLPPTG